MKITEPALTAEMKPFMEQMGYQVFPPEMSTEGHKRADVIFKIHRDRFVLECEIGIGYKKLIEGIQQVSKYERDLRNQGIHTTANIVMVYPPSVRVNVRSEEEAASVVRDILCNQKIKQVIMLPPFVEFPADITLKDLLKILEEEYKIREVSINFVTKVLNETVDTLESIILPNINERFINVIVNSFDFFKVLTTDVNSLENEEIYKQIARLGGYILVNQILFYHLLTTELRSRRDYTLTELSQNVTIRDLRGMFRYVIEEIDYDPIFTIDIIGNINEEFTDIIRQIINVIISLKPEIIRHDLLGTIYHNLIPQEIRKKLAAFFTIPVAAEILTSLVIKNVGDKILDPSSGSGTILASSYRKKMNLAKSYEKFSEDIYPLVHKQFIENQITGIDIMPFSAHLSAMNLTIQAPFVHTRKVRIGVDDFISLDCGKRVGALVEDFDPFLFPEYQSGSSEEEIRKLFKVSKVDCVIMNPPFTKKRRLTKKMKEPINRRWWKKSGSFHYWAHFLLHCTSFLKKNGKIGTVLPLGAIALKDGFKILDMLKRKGLNPKYIVKSKKDMAFSESARFRDYLVVFDKDQERRKMGFVYLKKRLTQLTLHSARIIGDTIASIEEGIDYEDDNISVIWKQLEYLHNNNSFWECLELHDPTSSNVRDFYINTFYNNPRITTLQSIISTDQINYFAPAKLKGGVRHSVFIGRDDSTRTKLLIQQDERSEFLIVYIKNTDITFKVPRNSVMMGLKTGSYVSSIDAGNQDYFIKSRYSGFESIERSFGSNVDFDVINDEMERIKGNLSINRRFDFTAEGFRLFAYYSDVPMVTTEMLWTIGIEDIDLAKILSLWFNSSIFMLNLILSKRKETGGSYSQTDKYKIIQFPVPDINALSVEQKQSLLSLFERVKNVSFPSFLDQVLENHETRMLIDKAFLEIIGFEYDEIEDILVRINTVLKNKCNECRQVMRKNI